MSEIASLIDGVVRDALTGPLKAAGYRKDGRTFRRRVSDAIQVVNAQSSAWNSGADGQFTLNLGVYFPAVVPLLDWVRLTDRPSEADCLVRQRIGLLLPVERDQWWRVNLSTDRVALAGEVRDAWERYGQPWLAAHSELRAAREFVIGQRVPYWAAAISLVLGERDAARSYLQEALAAFPAGAAQLRAWGERHGLDLGAAV